ncbi:hypothetical protein, partial [Pseudomonas sp. Sample_10]|uniref:hypothetical protein n=1 Tax=Pseudomonas sp. Sample_10 TaxID=2448269 RepID=UPI0019D62828
MSLSVFVKASSLASQLPQWMCAVHKTLWESLARKAMSLSVFVRASSLASQLPQWMCAVHKT